MFIRKHLGFFYCDPAGNDGAVTGNTGQQQQNNSGQQTGQQAGQNNTQNSLTDTQLIDNIWASDKETVAQPNQLQQQPASITDPQTIFQQHYQSLGITSGVNVREIADQIANGQNVEETLSKAFDSFGQNIYRSSLLAINKIVENRVKQAEETLKQSATGELRADLAVNRMTDVLPFTGDPKVLPVAKAVLNQFLKKGNDLPTAIKNTGEYFKAVNAGVSKHFKLNSTQQPATRRGGFVDPAIQQDEENLTDWVNLLKG